MDKNQSENDKKEFGDEVLPAPVNVNEKDRPKGASASEQKQQRSKEPHARRRARNITAVVIETCGLIVLCLYTYFSYHQWKAMEASNDRTRESNDATRRLGLANLRLITKSNDTTAEGIAEARRQAKSALKENQRLNSFTGDLVEEARRQIATANKAIEESNRQAEAARKIAIETIEESRVQAKAARELEERTFRHGARARMLVERFQLQGDTNIWVFGPVETWKGIFAPVGVTVRNVGGSNAIVTVRFTLVFTAYIESPEVIIAEVEARAKGAGTPLHPKCDDLASFLDITKPIERGESAEFVLPLAFGGQLNEKQIKSFESGKLKVNLVGCVRSRDELGEVHETRVCAFLEPWGVDFNFINSKRTHKLRKQEWTPCNDNNLEEGLKP